MQGRTHLIAGITAALWLMQPRTIPELAFGSIFGAVGGIICDIDIAQSKPGRFFRKFILISAIICTVGLLYPVVGNASDLNHEVIRTAAEKCVNYLPIIVLCLIGSLTRHRSFTHSLVGMALFSISVKLAAPYYAVYFMAGYASHLLLDFMNIRGMQLLFPLKQRFSMALCKAGGTCDRILSIILLLFTGSYLWYGEFIQNLIIVRG